MSLPGRNKKSTTSSSEDDFKTSQPQEPQPQTEPINMETARVTATGGTKILTEEDIARTGGRSELEMEQERERTRESLDQQEQARAAMAAATEAKEKRQAARQQQQRQQ